MRRTDLLDYLEDLGWRDPPELGPGPVGHATPAAPSPEPRSEAARVQERPASTPAPGPARLPGTLDELQAVVAGCTLCSLADGRRNTVFGEGNPDARLMFVGEAPGAEEDRTGRPFVGPAGRLLDGMIRAMGLERADVFIANVLKCRPPGNRDPKPEEAASCAPYLDRQVELIRPEVLVALGRPASQRLTGTDKPMGAMRGRWTSYRGVPVICTYHPAYLLRNPKGKAQAWSDLKQVLERLAG